MFPQAWARGKCRGFSPGAAARHRSRTKIFLSFFGGFPLFFEIRRLPLHFWWDRTSFFSHLSDRAFIFFHDFLRSDFMFYLSSVIFPFFQRFWDQMSPQSEIRQPSLINEVRSQNEKTSNLRTRRRLISKALGKIEGRRARSNQGEKNSRNKSVVTLVWPLWCTADLGFKPIRLLRARQSGSRPGQPALPITGLTTRSFCCPLLLPNPRVRVGNTNEL